MMTIVQLLRGIFLVATGEDTIDQRLTEVTEEETSEGAGNCVTANYHGLFYDHSFFDFVCAKNHTCSVLLEFPPI